MPRGRNADDRLAELERRLNALETEEACSPDRPKYTNEELVEIGLILLAYVCEGSTKRFAEILLKNLGAPFEAEEIAGRFGRILEERRTVALIPRCPV